MKIQSEKASPPYLVVIQFGFNTVFPQHLLEKQAAAYQWVHTSNLQIGSRKLIRRLHKDGKV
jgi:hypothetical protein